MARVRLDVNRPAFLALLAELDRFGMQGYSIQIIDSIRRVEFTAPVCWLDLLKNLRMFGPALVIQVSEDDKPHPSDHVEFKNTAVRETAAQVWEYNVLELLTAASNQLHAVPVVSEDYVTRRMRYENAISDFIRAMKNNGRLT